MVTVAHLAQLTWTSMRCRTPDAWDSDKDGKPDAYDNDGDGAPDIGAKAPGAPPPA